MRVHGWCSECRRPRLVTATSSAVARRAVVPAGTCADCQHRLDVTARITARYGRTWEAEIRVAAELAGHRVRSVHHDAMTGFTILLEDGREIEEATPRRACERLTRLPRAGRRR